MTLAHIASAYLNLNFLIIIGFLGLLLFKGILHLTRFEFEARRELRLHYAVILAILAWASIYPLLPRNEFFSPAAKFGRQSL